MHLVQILLPVYDSNGDPFDAERHHRVRTELTDEFGGVTAYVRAPAKGTWKDDDGSVARDDVVVYEVMVDSLDRDRWASLRERLRQQFEQEELVVRALSAERL
jgi:hypothetical protein